MSLAATSDMTAGFMWELVMKDLDMLYPISLKPFEATKIDHTSSKHIRECCRKVLMWADQFEQARSKITERITKLAKARADIEKGLDPALVKRYSDLQKEFRKLLATLYLTLENINQALDKLILICDQHFEKVQLNHSSASDFHDKEIYLIELFMSPKYRKMFDYDQEIENLNNHFDKLVHRFLGDC